MYQSLKLLNTRTYAIDCQLFAMPTEAHALGQAGESAAAAFYQQAGYELLAQGYRYGRAEVDLIVRRGDTLLVFVEVKTRSGGQYGPPETFVSARKKELFRLAATHLQEELAWQGDIRFDILALTQLSTGFRIELFEDAFY
jgi:putative endonuclease